MSVVKSLVLCRFGLLAGVLCCTAGPVGAQGQDQPSMVVSGAGQAARDSDRLRILNDELARETNLAEEQAKRKAERLMARDEQGVEESSAALQRHAQNIQALRREIDRASRAPTSAARRSSPATLTASPRPLPAASAARDASGTPWWDVYGRAPKRPPSAVPENADATMVEATLVAPTR